MRYCSQISMLTILLILYTLVSSQNAYAYLDPGSGSYILQLMIAGILGASFFLKIFWRNIRSYVMFRILKRGDGKSGNGTTASQQ
jgi:hypothetical protein